MRRNETPVARTIYNILPNRKWIKKKEKSQRCLRVRRCHYLGGFDGRILIDLLGAPLTLVGAVKVHRDARFVGSIEPLDFGVLHDVHKVAKIVGSILYDRDRQKETNLGQRHQSWGREEMEKKEKKRLVKSRIQVLTMCSRRE